MAMDLMPKGHESAYCDPGARRVTCCLVRDTLHRVRVPETSKSTARCCTQEGPMLSTLPEITRKLSPWIHGTEHRVVLIEKMVLRTRLFYSGPVTPDSHPDVERKTPTFGTATSVERWRAHPKGASPHKA